MRRLTYGPALEQCPEPEWDLNPKLVMFAANRFPTRAVLREFLAPASADTILQIVRRDAVYRGLGDRPSDGWVE